MQTTPTPDSADAGALIEHEAAEWLVRLSEGSAAERQRAAQAFAAWKATDPRHARAAAGMEAFLAQLERVRQPTGGDGRAARAALEAALHAPAGRHTRNTRNTRRTRRAVTALGLALILGLGLGLPLWLVARSELPAQLLADFHTRGGQWQVHTLADGTRISLQGGSAVELHYDARRRALRLLQGDLLVEVAKDAGRPFLVETGEGSIEALGTRFVVQRSDGVTRLAMLESRVRVQAAGHEASVLVAAGQGVRIDGSGVGAIVAVDVPSIEDAWRDRQLVVDDRPLAEVLDQLGRNRPGWIRYDRRQIAGIRVSAVLPLDDTDRALQLLANQFPALRIRSFSAWMVWVDRPPEN